MADFVLYHGAYNGPQVDAAISRALSGGALDQRIDAVESSPLEAATVAEMTNENRVYVYTGSEAGYTAGNWYYWDGAAWTSGGTYQSASADAALSDVSVNPVQNKVVKAALDLKADKTETAELQRQILASFPQETPAPAAIITFADGADGIAVKDLSVAFEADANGRTGLSVTRCGENLFDPSVLGFSYSAGEYTGNANKQWTLTLPFKASTQYTLRFVGRNTSSTNTAFRMVINYTDGTSSNTGNVTSQTASTKTLTSTAGKTIKNITRGYSTSAGIALSEIQLVEGTSAGTFEEYSGTTISVDWTDAAGSVTLAGTIDITTGILTLSNSSTYQLTLQDISTLLGFNTLYTAAGTISLTYRADVGLYIARQ